MAAEQTVRGNCIDEQSCGASTSNSDDECENTCDNCAVRMDFEKFARGPPPDNATRLSTSLASDKHHHRPGRNLLLLFFLALPPLPSAAIMARLYHVRVQPPIQTRRRRTVAAHVGKPLNTCRNNRPKRITIGASTSILGLGWPSGGASVIESVRRHHAEVRELAQKW